MKTIFHTGLALAIICVLQCSRIYGQTFLNGSFENTTANCEYQLFNNDFNYLMIDCFGFGNATQIDILDSSCGFGSAHHGNYFIGLAVDDTFADAVSLKLSTALTAGNTYLLNFHNNADPNYDSNALAVGYSDDSLSFGTIIDTADFPLSPWAQVTFTFTPNIDCQFITVLSVPGTFGWNLIDDFSISLITGKNDFSIIPDDIKIYPNPFDGFISIETNPSIQIFNTKIMDTQGRTIFFSEKDSVQLADFGPGLFVLEFNTNKGRIVKRIIHQ